MNMYIRIDIKLLYNDVFSLDDFIYINLIKVNMRRV